MKLKKEEPGTPNAIPGNKYSEESIFIPFRGTDQLHVYRLNGRRRGRAVFLLHGSIENGRIFYSSSGKGLAPFLAAQGYDVFVADLRGKGKSVPPIHRHSRHGITECILEEIPALLEAVTSIHGSKPDFWMAHSWGGVELLCHLARIEDPHEVKALVFFGTKRRITISGWRKLLAVDLFYRFIFRSISRWKGYVDVHLAGVGSDNETENCRRQTYQWVTSAQWKDTDGFDYLEALQKINLPPALYLTGAADQVLGHPVDVDLLRCEIAHRQSEFQVAGVQNGNLHDYDHISLLTHPDAPRDHFLQVIQFLEKHSS